MEFTDSMKNYSLLGAVDNNDFDAVLELLENEADANYKPTICSSLMDLALKKNNVEIIIVLALYGFNSENTKVLTDLLLKHSKNTDFVIEVFIQLMDYNGEETLKILDLLLDNGLPVDDFIGVGRNSQAGNEFTPLHLSVMEEGRYLLTSKILEHGADINRKTLKGQTPLFLAIEYDNYSGVKVLLKNGAKPNEQLDDGDTAIHSACRMGSMDIIEALLHHGADLNIIDKHGNTPFTQENIMRYGKINDLVRELALLRFQGRPISDKNLEKLRQNVELRYVFEDCLVELQRMKDFKFYNDFSFYDIIKMSRQREKLAFLTANEDFVAAYRLLWKRELFRFCGKFLDDIFDKAAAKGKVLQVEEKKLISVFKGCLPELAIRKIVYFTNENLFD